VRPRAKQAAVILGVVACIATVLLLSHREPRQNGRTLSQWLRILRASDTTAEQREVAAKAIREIGADGLPLLLRRATSTESPLAARLRAFLIRSGTSLAPARLHKWAHAPLDQTRANEAKLGFVILGSQAAPAIPALTKIARARHRTEAGAWANNELGEIGPSALPALLSVIHDENAACRADAILALESMGTNAASALPAVIRALDDPNPNVAYAGAYLLGRLGLNPEICLPALCKCLGRPDRYLKLAAISSIARFRPEAKAMIPELRSIQSIETDLVAKTYMDEVILNLEEKASPRVMYQHR
jgi:hypothetical protein